MIDLETRVSELETELLSLRAYTDLMRVRGDAERNVMAMLIVGLLVDNRTITIDDAIFRFEDAVTSIQGKHLSLDHATGLEQVLNDLRARKGDRDIN
jgi:hypothetical protein